MNYSDFIDTVARRAEVPSPAAEGITRATLETFADRVTEGLAKGVGKQLPPELREHLHKTTNTINAQFAESFGHNEFIRRVSGRAGVDRPRAEAGIRAVLATVGEAVSGTELQDMESQLPKEYWEMVQSGARAEAPRRG